MANPVIDFPWTYAHVAATTVPAVKVGPGVLHGINFNGMTVIGVLEIYDGIDNTGTVIGAITLDSAGNLISLVINTIPNKHIRILPCSRFVNY